MASTIPTCNRNINNNTIRMCVLRYYCRLLNTVCVKMILCMCVPVHRTKKNFTFLLSQMVQSVLTYDQSPSYKEIECDI